LTSLEKGHREEDLAAVAEIYGIIKGFTPKKVDIAKRILKAFVIELKEFWPLSIEIGTDEGNRLDFRKVGLKLLF